VFHTSRLGVSYIGVKADGSKRQTAVCLWRNSVKKQLTKYISWYILETEEKNNANRTFIC
jgi:hypothetical protein